MVGSASFLTLFDNCDEHFHNEGEVGVGVHSRTGGVGPETGDTEFLDHSQDDDEDPETGGVWHNSLVCYDPQQRAWEWPHVQGAPPCPRAGAAAARLKNVVFIFGG